VHEISLTKPDIVYSIVFFIIRKCTTWWWPIWRPKHVAVKTSYVETPLSYVNINSCVWLYYRYFWSYQQNGDVSPDSGVLVRRVVASTHTRTHSRTHTHKGRTCFCFPCAHKHNINLQRKSHEQLSQFCCRPRWIFIATHSFRDRFFPDLSPWTSTGLEARNQERCLALILAGKLLLPASQGSSWAQT
jgi:hypothetical protein